jgi:hypothetical protein
MIRFTTAFTLGKATHHRWGPDKHYQMLGAGPTLGPCPRPYFGNVPNMGLYPTSTYTYVCSKYTRTYSAAHVYVYTFSERASEKDEAGALLHESFCLSLSFSLSFVCGVLLCAVTDSLQALLLYRPISLQSWWSASAAR